jgi:hypothetical protein
LFLITSCDAFPFAKNFLIWFHQPKEEASSGGDQLASNKVDA